MNLERFKHACFMDGVPDHGSETASLRAISWKLLLNYLPSDRSQWQAHLAEQRASYRAFCDELTTDPHKHGEGGGGAGGEGAGVDDDPLTAQAGSKWAEWHADEELRHEIQKDVDRTLPDYAFYNREQPMGKLHHGAISRVLFIYAKLNPGIRYVQGMNEILAPIYYVFCQEIDDQANGVPPPPPPPSDTPPPTPPQSPPQPGAQADDPLSLDPLGLLGTPPPAFPPQAPPQPAADALADPPAGADDPLRLTPTSPHSPPPATPTLPATADTPSDPLSAGQVGPLASPVALDVWGRVPAPPVDVSEPNAAGVPPISPAPSTRETGADGGRADAVDVAEDAADDSKKFGADLPEKLALALDAVEADAFFCFTNLMAELRDHFCSKLDHTNVGITAKVQTMERLIGAKDAEVGRVLSRLRVSPTFYGFRWITLLLTQEWDLPDVLRLWDTLLSDPKRFDFLLYFCTATVLSIRNELIENDDFAYAVKTLQRFEGRVPMHALLKSAQALYADDHPLLWAV